MEVAGLTLNLAEGFGAGQPFFAVLYVSPCFDYTFQRPLTIGVVLGGRSRDKPYIKTYPSLSQWIGLLRLVSSPIYLSPNVTFINMPRYITPEPLEAPKPV